MSDLLTIGLDEISLDEANPRQHIDEERIAELAASIELHGVIQPVIVRRGGAGESPYVIVAGQRRLLATIKAGKATIPGILRDTNGSAGAVALVENLQREQLSPIEEANAFKRAIADGSTVDAVAQAVGVSEQLVKDRLSLLELPEKVQEKVGGTVTIAAARQLGKIAAVSPAVATAVAEAIDSDESWNRISSSDVDRDPGEAIEAALDTEAAQDVFAADAFHLQADVRDFDNERRLELQALIKQLPGRYDSFFSGKRSYPLELDNADRDAARAYGCLLEVERSGRGGPKYGWIVDEAWLFDRLKMKLEAAIAAKAKGAKAPATSKAKAGETDADKAARELRDRERNDRKKQQAAMLAARERNVELGVKLFKELHAPEPTLESMQLLAGLLLEYAGEDLGRRGLRYIDADSQTVTTKKDGTISRVTHLRGTIDARTLLQARLEACTTAQQVHGVLLQAIAAAHYADVGAAASSDRYGRVRGLDGHVTDFEILPLVEKVAGGHIPASVVEARAKTQTRRARR